MDFEGVYVNRVNLTPPGKARASSVSESNITWADGGILSIVQELQARVEDLQGRLAAIEGQSGWRDLIPAAEIDADTFYELASDGTLRAGVDVAVEGSGLFEVALLGAPTVVTASKDATIRQDQPNNNDSYVLDVGVPVVGAAHRGWMQCPWGTWPGTGLWAAQPVLAVLRLVKSGYYNTDGVEVVLRAEDPDGGDWGETAINWNNQPSLEGMDRVIDCVVNAESDTVHYWDLTPFVYRAREARSGPWGGTPYGLVICQRDEGQAKGRVRYYTRHDSNPANRPQIWYWERVVKSQVLGGAVKTARIYGTPGQTYYLVYRQYDENNNAGRWSWPVAVTLPSQGAAPAKPSTPAKVDTQISNLKYVVLTTNVPPDFAHFHVHIYEEGTAQTTEFNTRVDRLLHWFPSLVAMGGSSYKVKYKIVTRSGAESPYSNVLSFTTEPVTTLYSPDGGSWLQLYNELSDATIRVDGSLGNMTAQGSEGTYQILTARPKSVGYHVLDASCGQASYDTTQTTTSTSWVDRTGGSITLTPPGTGNAYYLLVGKMTVFKDGADAIKMTFKVDGTATNDEEAYSASSTAETVAFVRRVAVTAGSSHTFKLCFRSNNGGSCTVYRSNIIALHLGNY
jgi:hypothetical protein